MRGLVLVGALMAPGMAAAAGCAGAVILSCPVVGSEKYIDVCAGPQGFRYAFGPDGAPELQLTAAYDTGPVTPWSGVGRSIWSSVRFLNEDYAYDAWISVDRLVENAPLEGGVMVMSMPGEEVVAEVACRAGEVSGDIFGPSDSMAQAGYCWSHETFAWRPEGQCD